MHEEKHDPKIIAACPDIATESAWVEIEEEREQPFIMDKMLVVVFDHEDKAAHGHDIHSGPQQTDDTHGDTPRVLLLRSDPAGSSALMDRLQQSGCECRVAAFQEGMTLLTRQHFHVVLSQFGVADIHAHRLISQLTGSDTSLFFRLEVEDGCWWLPAVITGKNCWGAPAIRPKDFHPVLKEILEQMTSGVHPISAGNSAVLATCVPSAWALQCVNSETSPARCSSGVNAAVRWRENKIEIAVNGN